MFSRPEDRKKGAPEDSRFLHRRGSQDLEGRSLCLKYYRREADLKKDGEAAAQTGAFVNLALPRACP